MIKFQRAHSRLYRHQSLQVNARFSAFFEIDKIVALSYTFALVDTSNLDKNSPNCFAISAVKYLSNIEEKDFIEFHNDSDHQFSELRQIF